MAWPGCAENILKNGQNIFLIQFVLLLFLSRGTSGAERKIIIDSLFVNEGHLVACYHIDGLLDQKLVEGLQKGFTSEIVHHIRLWRSKALISSLVAEIFYPITINYDNWETKYAITTESESRLTAQIETVREKCTILRDYPLAQISDLDPGGKYYVDIQVTIQPISAQKYQELREWLSSGSGDEERRGDQPERIKRGRFFGVLINLLGFGDKRISVKTDDFIVLPRGDIEYVQ